MSRTKRVSPQVREAFGRELTRWVNENHGGNQTHAAKALGVTQSHVSAMMSGDRGPGLNTLILLREKTGKSLDELLGLGPPPGDTLVEQLRASFGLDVARFRAEAKRTLEEAREIASRARPERSRKKRNG